MPKVLNISDSDKETFLQDVQASLNKCARRAKMMQTSNKAHSKPKVYWQEQQRRMHDPKCKSFDLLTPYIAN